VLKVDAATGARTLFASYLGAENYALFFSSDPGPVAARSIHPGVFTSADGIPQDYLAITCDIIYVLDDILRDADEQDRD
jgi:hypothetical protein